MILTILLLTVKVKHIRMITPHRGSAPWCEYRGKHALTHPGRMLLHLMLAAVWAAGVAAPEAVLAELVTTATEAAVAEACHAVAATVGTGDGMVDWDGGRSQSVSVTARWWWRWWWWCFYKDLCVCLYVCIPCSTLAIRCISGNQTRHCGGSDTMSRNMLSVTLFYELTTKKENCNNKFQALCSNVL